MFYKMPDLEFVRSILEVDTARGGLRWRARYGRAWPGDTAGFNVKTGYRRVMLDGKTYAVSRLVWYIHTGKDPGEAVIRHLDGDPQNDRLSNIRIRRRGKQSTSTC